MNIQYSNILLTIVPTILNPFLSKISYDSIVSKLNKKYVIFVCFCISILYVLVTVYKKCFIINFLIYLNFFI